MPMPLKYPTEPAGQLIEMGDRLFIVGPFDKKTNWPPIYLVYVSRTFYAGGRPNAKRCYRKLKFSSEIYRQVHAFFLKNPLYSAKKPG